MVLVGIKAKGRREGRNARWKGVGLALASRGNRWKARALVGREWSEVVLWLAQRYLLFYNLDLWQCHLALLRCKLDQATKKI